MIINELHSNIQVHFRVDSKDDLKIPYVIYAFIVEGDKTIYRYVGQSHYGLKHRITTHCSDCWKRTDNSKKANVMRKYKKLTAFILCKCHDVYELDKKEREYIELYHIKYGRECLNTLLFVDKYKKRVPVTCIDTKYRVEQYDLKGNYIRTFSSIRDAARTLGISRNVISHVINKTAYTAGGFQWKLERDDSDMQHVLPHCSQIINGALQNKKACNVRIGRKSHNKHVETKLEKRLREQKARGKTIVQYDLNGNFLHEYPSLHSAQEDTGVNIKAISNCCKGIYAQSNGFQFRYKSSDLPIERCLKTKREQTIDFNVKSKGIKVIQYDKNMNLIATYNSRNQAKNATGFCGIWGAIDKNKLCHNYYWKRA